MTMSNHKSELFRICQSLEKVFTGVTRTTEGDVPWPCKLEPVNPTCKLFPNCNRTGQTPQGTNLGQILVHPLIIQVKKGL